MRSLWIVSALAVLVVWLADAVSDHDGIVILIRSVALLVLLAWIGNVFGCVTLPIAPW